MNDWQKLESAGYRLLSVVVANRQPARAIRLSPDLMMKGNQRIGVSLLSLNSKLMLAVA